MQKGSEVHNRTQQGFSPDEYLITLPLVYFFTFQEEFSEKWSFVMNFADTGHGGRGYGGGGVNLSGKGDGCSNNPVCDSLPGPGYERDFQRVLCHPLLFPRVL
jgi:hypothetical protein